MHDARISRPDLHTIALTAAAMVAFAANSLLCRLALQRGGIDPASFSGIRLASGAFILILILRFRTERPEHGHGDWLSAALLFAYVAFFSFAYLSLPAGTGALILFGAVQLTMFGAGLLAGEMLASAAWFGLVLAAAGLVYLVSPGIAAPPLAGAAMMATAGVAWAMYSLRGRGVSDPLGATAGNFWRATPFALVLSLFFAGKAYADAGGIALAIASGALTSGIGYVIWFAALRQLTSMQAATVQLGVPLIAAFCGVAFLSEVFTPRLAASTAAILGGIALVLGSRQRARRT